MNLPPPAGRAALAERAELARINIEICRALWRGETLSHRSAYFEFTDVALKPRPVKSDSHLDRR